MMRQALAPILWIYDFLVEDATILIGAAIAIAVCVLLVHVASGVAGYALWVLVLASIAVSVWRTATA